MKNREILQKIVRHIDKIQQYCQGKDYQSFCEDTQLVEACVFNLSQMGELINRLDDAFTEQYAEIPWHQIRGLRNRIIHDYDGVNLKLVWEIIETDLEKLRGQLLSI